MKAWRWIVGAVVGLLALLALRRKPTPAPPVDAARQLREKAARDAEALLWRHAEEKAQAERERQHRDESIRQAAEKEQARDAVDRANDGLDAMGWRPPGNGGDPAGGGG